jgi:predicted nucleic acid-binding protein
MDLAEKHALAAIYDAHYLVVAEQLDAELWTADRRLFEAVSDALPSVRRP